MISQTPSDPGMVIDECLLSSGKVRVYSWLNNSLQEITVSDGKSIETIVVLLLAVSSEVTLMPVYD